MATAAYYFLAHAGGVLAPREAAGLVITALMVQSLLTEPLGRPLDFTEPIAHALHAVRCVRRGSAEGAGGRGRALWLRPECFGVEGGAWRKEAPGCRRPSSARNKHPTL